jgi:predicted nucleotidyltransferase
MPGGVGGARASLAPTRFDVGGGRKPGQSARPRGPGASRCSYRHPFAGETATAASNVNSRSPSAACAPPLHHAEVGAACDDRKVKDLVRVVSELVASHPAVRDVELAGSRSRGTHEELSDWDFAVTTSDFEYVARDLPTLVAPLRPLGEQWEPMGHFPVFQVLLRGPTKIEYLFLDHSQEPLPAPERGPETLAAIDMHFWDWIWWIATKAFVGRDNLVAQHLSQLSEHLLRPMGVTNPPGGIDAAITTFVDRRDQVERKYGVKVPRALEDEVRRGVRRLGLST